MANVPKPPNPKPEAHRCWEWARGDLAGGCKRAQRRRRAPGRFSRAPAGPLLGVHPGERSLFAQKLVHACAPQHQEVEPAQTSLSRNGSTACNASLGRHIVSRKRTEIQIQPTTCTKSVTLLERSQPPRPRGNSLYGNVQTGQIHRDRENICACQERGGLSGVTAGGYGGSLRGDGKRF